MRILSVLCGTTVRNTASSDNFKGYMKMNRREFLKRCSVVAGGVTLAGSGCADAATLLSNKSLTASAGKNRPNIVIMLADDLGYSDLGCFGSELIQTPHLDQLAQEGIRLTASYAGAPLCSPSRTALLTGRNPNRAGIYSYIAPNSPVHLRAEEVTIATLLKQAGYETCQVGKWHLNSSLTSGTHTQPDDHGFDYWFGTPLNAEPTHYNPTNFVRNGIATGQLNGYAGHLVVDEAINWLENLRNESKPFFLYVPFHEPHRLLPAANDMPADIMAMYPNESGIGWPENGSRYCATVTNLDRAAGRLLAKLDEMGLRENTLVAFVSDNGSWRDGSQVPLRGKKTQLYEGGIRTPGIIRWPGHTKAGSASDVPVCFIDFAPTICNIVGLQMPGGRPIDGVSFLPVLQGKRIKRNTPLFWYFYKPHPECTLRQGDWVMIGYLDTGVPTSDHSLRDCHQTYLKNSSLVNFELYNIEKDISQEHNLVTAEPKRFDAMKKKMIQLHQEIIAEGHTWIGLDPCS